VDFDGDGRMDVLSGCWPGELYFFKNGPDGKFLAGEKIKGKDGSLLKPGSASTAFAVDFDGDGDLDLVCGNIEGEVTLYLNEGTKAKLEFAAGKKLEAGGKTIKVNHGDSHAVLADWDGDGKADLIVGTGAGGVMLYRNTGTSNSPKFAAGEVLLAEADHTRPTEDKKKDGVGTRVKVCVCDYNGDGRLDLLVGDFSYTAAEAPKLTDAQKKEQKEAQEKYVAIFAKNEKLFNEYAKTAQAPANETAEARTQREKKLKELQAQVDKVRKEARPYQEVMVRFQPRYEYHGWVWLVERKATTVAAAR
jgi:hypothetical protein